MTDWLVRAFMKNPQNLPPAQLRERCGRWACLVGIGSSLMLFGLKLTAGLLSGSVSMTADAVDSLSDSGASLVTLVGFKLGGKPADAEHPYGHARMEQISGLAVSFLILFMGIQVGRAALDKLLHPEPTLLGPAAALLLVVSLAIKGWQLGFYRKVGRAIDSPALLAAALDSRNDLLSTLAVLAAAVVARLTGLSLDGYMGLGVALLILSTAAALMRDTVSPLLGDAPPRELVEQLSEKILGYEGILGLHDLMIHRYGANQCFASVHCEVDAGQDLVVSHDLADGIERDCLRAYNVHLVIHLDPVGGRGVETSGG